jgi:hypothetical protein
VAEVGDEVATDGLLLRVEQMDGLRIAGLRVLPALGGTLTVDDADLVDVAEQSAEPEPASEQPASAQTAARG